MFTVNFDATQCTLTACTRPLFKAQSGLIGDQTSSERSRDAFGDSPSFGHSLGPWVLLAHQQMEVLEGARYSRANAFLSSGQFWGHHVLEGPLKRLVQGPLPSVPRRKSGWHLHHKSTYYDTL